MTSTLSTDTRFKSQGKNPGAAYFCVHAGSSMNPTLRELDVLEIIPYGNQKPKCGDVIYFVPPKGNQPVVHRITRITSQGIYARGDNNDKEDPWLIPDGIVEGKVVTSWRGRKRRRIYGGTKAIIWAYTIHRLQSLKSALFYGLHPVYRALSHPGLINHFLPARYQPRIVLYRSKGHSRIKLVIANRIAGYYDHHLHEWHIKRPFRLLVNKSYLTRPSGTADEVPSFG